MMWAYHTFVIGGLVIAIIVLALAVRDQARANRWMTENFDDPDYDVDDYEPELSAFEQEVADLNDNASDQG